MKKVFSLGFLAAVVMTVAMVFPSQGPKSFHKDGGVQFYLEDKRVTAAHLYDNGEAFKSGKPDLFIKEKDKKEAVSFEISEEMVKPNDFVLIMLPEGPIRARVVDVNKELRRFIFDPSIRVRPGFSGSPIVSEKTGKVVGIVIAMGLDPLGMGLFMHGLGQVIEKKDLNSQNL